jgi:WD40 repeat protein
VAALGGGGGGGARVATGSSDGRVLVWDVALAEGDGGGEGGPVLHALRGHRDAVVALAALAGGDRLASGSWDRSVIVWDVRREVALLQLPHPQCVRALVAARGGQRLAVGCDDGRVFVWAVAAERRRRLEAPEEAVKAGALTLLEGHTSWVRSLAELPDGRLASGSNDRTVRVWERGWEELGATRACAEVLGGHAGPVTALAALPDGRLAAGDAASLRLWDVRFEKGAAPTGDYID